MCFIVIYVHVSGGWWVRQDRRHPVEPGARRHRGGGLGPALVRVRRPRGRRVDREHEHRPRRQQEALPLQRRDHEAHGPAAHDLRGGGPRRCLPGHRLPLRHGLPGLQGPRPAAAAGRLAAALAPAGQCRHTHNSHYSATWTPGSTCVHRWRRASASCCRG